MTDLILPAVLGAWGDAVFNTNEYQASSLGEEVKAAGAEG
jgi:hypothetical protein